MVRIPPLLPILPRHYCLLRETGIRRVAVGRSDYFVDIGACRVWGRQNGRAIIYRNIIPSAFEQMQRRGQTEDTGANDEDMVVFLACHDQDLQFCGGLYSSRVTWHDCRNVGLGEIRI